MTLWTRRGDGACGIVPVVKSVTDERSVLITVRLRTAQEFPGVTFISMRRYTLEDPDLPEHVEASNSDSALRVLEAWMSDSHQG